MPNYNPWAEQGNNPPTVIGAGVDCGPLRPTTLTLNTFFAAIIWETRPRQINQPPAKSDRNKDV